MEEAKLVLQEKLQSSDAKDIEAQTVDFKTEEAKHQFQHDLQKQLRVGPRDDSHVVEGIKLSNEVESSSRDESHSGVYGHSLDDPLSEIQVTSKEDLDVVDLSINTLKDSATRSEDRAESSSASENELKNGSEAASECDESSTSDPNIDELSISESKYELHHEPQNDARGNVQSDTGSNVQNDTGNEAQGVPQATSENESQDELQSVSKHYEVNIDEPDTSVSRTDGPKFEMEGLFHDNMHIDTQTTTRSDVQSDAQDEVQSEIQVTLESVSKTEPQNSSEINEPNIGAPKTEVQNELHGTQIDAENETQDKPQSDAQNSAEDDTKGELQPIVMYPELHHLVSEILEKNDLHFTFHNVDDEDVGRYTYTTSLMTHFRCPCRNKWRSMCTGITIRMYPDNRYNARIYAQSCKRCRTLCRPMPNKTSYAERVSYRIKYWCKIRQERPPSPKQQVGHIPRLCEGCKIGRCPYRAALAEETDED